MENDQQGKSVTDVGKSIVSVVPCPIYDQETINNAIHESFQNIGGISSLIQSNTRILIKPNLLSAKDPRKAVTTHPMVVCAVVEYMQHYGAKVTIGDSPAGISQPIEHYWDITGMKDVAAATGARLMAFEKNGVVERKVNGKSYYVAKPVIEADLVINVCKMKTHGLTLFTGAIKNMFGTIPGVKKGEFHKLAPKVKAFSEILVDIFEAVKPQLNIMDAIVAMEGNGPSSGKPKNVGYLLMSTDAVAMDAVAAHIMGFESDEILTTQIASGRGLGISKLDQIDIKGVNSKEIKPAPFHLPSNRIIHIIPEFLMKLVGRMIWIRPKAIDERCKRCGLCIENCPVQAMISREKFPIIDDDRCIKCFCCDEICPHNAIEQQMSWLAKKLK